MPEQHQNMGDEPEDSSPARQRRDFRNFQNLIDKLIGEARSQGHFENLSGEGKPIHTGDDTHVAEEDRLGFRMLKSHGFAPPWMEARRDIEAERAKVDAWLRRTNSRWPGMHPGSCTAARVEYRAMLSELRRMILNYNLSTPQAAGQIDGIDLDAELKKLGTD